ncbi:hypothetical protein ZHAS_00002395 [Anopheles sinensis]|uniref:Secreted protein n=1 Tax=Anopheles sinensis TaxID=74873 RepID=A0A084VC63_ANOSI|nr:hypothetical protein ZHAS_00002395 [Anopheles sinensis]
MKFAIVLVALFAVACIQARPHPSEDDAAVAEVSAESGEENDVAVDVEADASVDVEIGADTIAELAKEFENNPEGRKFPWVKLLEAIVEFVSDLIAGEETST